jgi:hypothetical protein
MDWTTALAAGLVGGLAIAMQVGAVSLLLVDAAVSAGPRLGVAAGMGVATADFAFAAVAAAAGGTVSQTLGGHETEIRLVAAAALAGIAVYGLVRLRHALPAASAGPLPAGTAGPLSAGAARAHYTRFLAITAANPLTIASFAAVAASLSLRGPAAVAAFVAGVGAASAAWHLVLPLAAGHAGRRLTPRLRLGLAIAGRLGVLAIAARFVLDV